MGTTSNKTKQKWNAAHYSQIKISVNPELAEAFKNACSAQNVSMAFVLSQYMADFCQIRKKQKPLAEFSTRRQRRTVVKHITKQLATVKSFEEDYRDSIPLNLQGSVVYENADHAVSMIEDAIDILESVY